MNREKYIFAQLVSFLNEDKFRRLVDEYQGNRYIKHFTCWNQLLALMFGQLSNRESLRDLMVAIDAHKSKSYHLGFGKNVSKTSLARANQDRDYHIFEEYAYCLVAIVQHDMNLDRSTYEVLQILSISLTDKTPLKDFFDKTKNQHFNELYDSNEPNLFNF